MRYLAHPINHAHLIQCAHIRGQAAMHAQNAAIDYCLRNKGLRHRMLLRENDINDPQTAAWGWFTRGHEISNGL